MLVLGCVLVRSVCKLRISELEGVQVVLVLHICVFGFGWMYKLRTWVCVSACEWTCVSCFYAKGRKTEKGNEWY